MRLVERHIVKKGNKNYKNIDSNCFLSKNLYNYSLFLIKKHFRETGKVLRYREINEILKNEKHENYMSLPNNTSQQILIVLDKNIGSYFSTLRSWKKDKTKFSGCPKFPRYKDKIKGRNLLVFTINQCKIKDDLLKFPKKIKLKSILTKVTEFKQVRIVPQTNCYVVEIVYEKQEKQNENIDSEKYIGIDLGVNNVCSITSNQPGLNPLLVNGKILKSINQYYNKKKSKLQSQLKNGIYTSNKIKKLTHKRNNKIQNYLHHVSKYIIDYCIENEIGNIIIGKNNGWKQDTNIGRKNNQNFVNIPFDKLIHQLEYKGKLQGINVKTINESYTSKCSFLDNEKICKHEEYLGKRIKRGLFKSKNGICVNADVNASYNILRKELGDDENLTNNRAVMNPLKVIPLKNRKLLNIF